MITRTRSATIYRLGEISFSYLHSPAAFRRALAPTAPRADHTVDCARAQITIQTLDCIGTRGGSARIDRLNGSFAEFCTSDTTTNCLTGGGVGTRRISTPRVVLTGSCATVHVAISILVEGRVFTCRATTSCEYGDASFTTLGSTTTRSSAR